MTGAAGYRTRYVSGATLRTHAGYVRGNFAHYNCFSASWFRTHVTAWRPVAWRRATFWAGATWGALATALSYPATPVYYDYGANVVYQDNQVYIDGTEFASAEAYAVQAGDMAQEGRKAKTSKKGKWIPLGVFALVQEKEKDANDIFQLAINKKGIIRGNYYHAITDTTYPVKGAVDQKTQRAAWTVGKAKDTVYETGIANLTKPETTVLIHFGKKGSQQWTLVRVDPPKDKNKDKDKE
jgi:hypothetical protein